MNDVLIKYGELERLVERLNSIITEFESSGDRSDQIRDAVGYPFGRSELTAKASEAESRWSYKRGKLTESLIGIRDHGQALYDEYQRFDTDAAAKFESGEQPPAS
ncbi:MAG: flagellar protein FlgN [Actinomycetota bacterium]